MFTLNTRIVTALSMFVAVTFILPVTAVQAQSGPVDVAAVEILQKTTEFMGSLKKFSVHTQNTLEDVLDSGQRIDYDISAWALVSRPNKLRSQRTGGLVNQTFFYDGEKVVMYDQDAAVYAEAAAPGTIDELLDFAREDLNILFPVSDLVYTFSFPLLMQDVTSAIVLEQTSINGVICDHVAFAQPGVEFQLWVAAGEKPFPCKYVVTDTTSPELISISTVMSDWDFDPKVKKDSFTFVPPKGTEKTAFTNLE
jgi:hypothetical protein